MAEASDSPADRSSDQERMLSQALRAMAGGRPDRGAAGSGGSGVESSWSAGTGTPNSARGLTTMQILLIAAIIGVLLGMGTALVLLAIT